MNRANEIITYLSKSQDSQLIVIAPNAPPIDRTPAGIKIALNQVLDASDVNDTLIALTSRTSSGGAATLGNRGTFSFGIRGVGQFRVTYFSQRGSRIVIIYRLAVTIPSLETVVQDPQLVQMLESRVRSTEGGLLIINGPHPTSNSTLAYSLLQQVNRTERRLIYCIERALTHILNHDNSVVIQSELGIDVCGFEDAIHTALILAPDVLFVGDLRL
ncbi:MAG: ATPase, T2SS/T4P/T4SS family, partial [Kiritimatiellia bacterium]